MFRINLASFISVSTKLIVIQCFEIYGYFWIPVPYIIEKAKGLPYFLYGFHIFQTFFFVKQLDNCWRNKQHWKNIGFAIFCEIFYCATEQNAVFFHISNTGNLAIKIFDACREMREWQNRKIRSRFWHFCSFAQIFIKSSN